MNNLFDDIHLNKIDYKYQIIAIFIKNIKIEVMDGYI
jgi:hypothetical protein